MKLTPGVNFIKVPVAAFTLADPESAKKTVKLSSFFALLGSASVKGARRTLVKLTPDLGLRRKTKKPAGRTVFVLIARKQIKR